MQFSSKKIYSYYNNNNTNRIESDNKSNFITEILIFKDGNKIIWGLGKSQIKIKINIVIEGI